MMRNPFKKKPAKYAHLTKRNRTEQKGVTYRVRVDGSRAYYVYSGGRQIPVAGGFREATRKQKELRSNVERIRTRFALTELEAVIREA